MSAGVLIVAAQRDLRRALFDTLDRAGHAPIHTARGLSHAAILLDGRAPLGLVVMAFDGDADDARQRCEQLRRIPACADAPLLAVLADGAGMRPSQLPEDVSDWLYPAQVEHELVARWQRARPPSALPAGAASDDYRFAFEQDDSEWLVVDPLAARVLEASPAVARNSRLGMEMLRGALLHDVLGFEGVAAEQVLEQADHAWYPCQRRAQHGADTGQASARRVRHGGREAVALLFRSDRADLRAEAALALLSRIYAAGGGLDMQKLVARLLLDELNLDYLALWSARPEERGGAPTLLAQLWRGDEQPAPALAQQGALRLVLGGRSLLHADDAQRLAASDPLLAELKLAGFVGLPLFDERRAVLGALLAGRRAPLGDMGIIEPVLRCAAARFAHSLELRRTREQGRAEGLIDALTGLPNRLLFNDRLDTIIREARRTGECFAVLFVDLDNFKGINDSHGHAAGDQVLRAVTQRLVGSVRASDTVARYAGDEFIVVLRHIVKTDDALRVAEKIVQVMEAPLAIGGGTQLQVTASIGISFYPDDAPDADTLLKHADEAMYAAKHLGRNNFQIYEVSPEQARQHDVALKSRLRTAARNGELKLVYQPQVDAASEDIVGMEALLRWEHPELGPISPATFIPLAEETGLIVSIGEWVLRTACAQAQDWERRYGLRLRLGVNLSAVQLMEADLLDTVAAVLRETGLDPGLLELEVTESISIKAVPNLLENLHGLHRLGCRIAIDDFGTGAASLDYLRKLPADRIKIDQSFVRNIGLDPDDEAIVRATIEMAHRLNRGVVAEGVEIESHLAFLRANQCDELQGYLFCRPLTQISFENLLAERQRLLAGAAAGLSAGEASPIQVA
ncbi:putative bifunctional diguanylate cyclase/phosphodiesterase [Fulvimonas soli]|jgi:diguanylate cyclase (GGDEF)-like protein|uniref:Diguanylate cyclase (GGDEF)-like protein n=1 Tax=Fulvimonas soli TaxID=155197 RepID=A0A316IKJ3_9GAMM|nr:EAL domain-containing protein [Fulvimonas soli]PWK93034.1 diguanylate cyclase (GGDEF)-like protein [Fulvimonas soli]TNY26392.1 GGDEF-domain containing protein [Fulvimonas soli]